MSLRYRMGLQWTASVCAALVLLGGCGASNRGASKTPPLAVTERDFHISTSTTQASAGDVTLRVDNRGPDQHELLVVPARSTSLPIRSDGFTVDEEALQSYETGSLEPGQPGRTRDLTLHLSPGRYVLFCNMEGHYMAGMHTILVVTP